MTIPELEAWFAKTELPKGPIQLFPGTTITNVQAFLESHFTILRKQPNSILNQPAFDRLMALKQFLELQALK